jgi:hypothetical protein
MRAAVLVWSTLSGAILGLFVDAMLVGVAAIVAAFVPHLRIANRWVIGSAAAALVAILVGMTVLGYLEGRLKAV